ncbi:MAG: MarR family winged helix-turn-helix transcriptional regulator [Bacteroidia bacterium]
MKLEDEIKQAKFKSVYAKLAVNISYTHFWVQDQMRQLLKIHQISLQQFNILRILRGQHPKPATINLLKERMLDKSSDASRLVERLRKKGLIERMVCEEDRRSVNIVITEKGLELLTKLESIDEMHSKIFDALSEEEATQLNNLLDKIRS